eukprot:gene27005-9023_t
MEPTVLHAHGANDTSSTVAAEPSTSAGNAEKPAGKRQICSKCERPMRTCLCSALPQVPVELRGRVVVLRHPFEKKKPLATVPVLSKQAKEMFNSSAKSLLPPDGPGILVQLPTPGLDETGAPPKDASNALTADQAPSGVSTGDEQACLIRKEPVLGYLLTHEAVARSLAILEKDPSTGDMLMEPLKLMTRYQAMHDPAVQARNAWAMKSDQPDGSRPIAGQKRPADQTDQMPSNA